MISTSVIISKIREDSSTMSAVYEAVFPLNHRAATAHLKIPVLNARYTVIKHDSTSNNSILIQIIKHNRGTQLAPFRFTAVMADGKQDTCLIMRQYDYERKRLRVTYSVAKKESGYEILIDEEECAKLDAIKGYTDLERNEDSALALDAGAFFMEWLDFDVADQKAQDHEEWIFV